VTQVPLHKDEEPVMGPGAVTTDTVSVDRQPPAVYVIIVVPAAIPVDAPVTGLMEAIPAGAIVQNPPDGPLEYAEATPTQTLTGPVMGNGLGLTVATVVEKQPVGTV
jgi:hypothetical protein